jgi:hypothetical protein
VVVVVRPGHDGLLVTDDRLGWTTLLSAGAEPTRKPIQVAGRQIAERLGVRFEHGFFTIDGVQGPEVASAILHVANASQAWVAEGLAASSQRQEREFGRRAETVVVNLFGRERVQFHDRVMGSSTRPYDVTMLVALSDERSAILEPVTNHFAAIASVYLKFNDVGRAHADWPREALIEHAGSWRAEDIVLLSDVGTGVTDLEADLTNLRRLAAA